MFSTKRSSPHKRSRTGSHSTTATTSATAASAQTAGDSTPLVSPLQMTFDFELHSPGATSPSLDLPFLPIIKTPNSSSARPATTHGSPVDSQKNDWSIPSGRLRAPTLPPIPRIASNPSIAQSAASDDSRKQESRARDESDNISTRSRRSVLQPRLSFEHPIDLLPSLSRPGTPSSAAVSSRRQTLGGQSIISNDPRMEFSLFPAKDNRSVSSPVSSNVPAMSRSFVDSRDKPYSQPPPRPFTLQTNHSSPDLIRTQDQSPLPSPKPPLSAVSATKTWVSPRPSLQNMSRSTYSGTTARPSTQASVSSSPSSTIGTPYQSTAESFPLPQFVAIRPKTSGPSSKLGGVAVLTHHTSTPKPVSRPSEKRKTRLLNPLALLQRRRSNQDTEDSIERQAQAQALARQRDVVASGVNKPPEDFDPRIKGKVVHDFSAPRRQRNTFDEIEWQHVMDQGAGASVHPPRNSSLISREASTDGGQRRSTHTPVFMEHLSENPEAARRISSIQAENLENKDFLHRASKQTTYSQESGVLPPFARRSQTLDPLQASLYQDDDSKRSSDPSSGRERNSTLSSVSGVSPITAQSNNPIMDIAGGMSPISPRSPSKGFGQLSNPKLPSQQGRQTLDESNTTPLEDVPRPVQDQIKSSLPDKEVSKNSGDVSMRPVVLALPTFSTIAEGSSHKSPVENSALQMPHLGARGLSIHQIDQARQARTPSPISPRSTHSADPKLLAARPLTQTEDIPTSERTPEPENVEPIKFKPAANKSKFVEKLASAVGHSRKSPTAPKHQPSNASRFSFQYGSEDAAQEQALEEKHRKLATSEVTNSFPRSRSPSEQDEDDYFDEGAMDDMDEMEMQHAQQIPQPLVVPKVSQPEASPQSSVSLQQARQTWFVQEPDDSDDESAFGDGLGGPSLSHDVEIPVANHFSPRTESAFDNHTRQASLATTIGGDGYWRGFPIDYYMQDSSNPSGHSRMQSQTSEYWFTGGSPMTFQGIQEEPKSLVGMEGHNHQWLPTASTPTASPSPSKPALPHRDSGNSERNRAVSGMSFGSPTATTPKSAQRLPSSPEQEEKQERVTSGTSYASRSDAVRSSQTTTSAISLSTTATSPPPLGAGEGTRISSGLSLGSPMSSPRLKKASLDGSQIPTLSRKDSLGNAPVAEGNSSLQQNVAQGNIAGSSARLSSHKRSLSSPKPRESRDVVNVVPEDAYHHANAVQGLPALMGHVSTNDLNLQRNAQGEHSRGGSGTQAMSLPVSSSPVSRPNSNLGAARFGSSGLAGFDFDDVPEETVPVAATSALQQELPQDKAASQMPFKGPSEENDDMYYDDGHFDQDISDLQGAGIDENAFDDDNFLSRPGMLQGINHRRDRSSAALTTTSLGSDGPYPSFAMPNASRVSQRYSQMMLEDLPLQAAPDPKFIPQRNPSEDMKRLGLSGKVPPVPVPETDQAAYQHMRAKLDSYHAALADAANKAAMEGRFHRIPSNSTTRSVSDSSKVAIAKPSLQVDNRDIDGESMYSDGEGGGDVLVPYSNNESAAASNIERSGTTISHLSHLTTYSPPKMSFDFGFDQADSTEDIDDSFMNDDDLVAAANAEALANDEDGFYGQEFDFYGRPRANSNEFQTINGGYFGQDGDDGLSRNKSLQEPNLTPITERSEFSTRNSFIGLNMSAIGPLSTGPYGPLSPAIARMPVTPLIEGEINSFDELRRLRANAFGDAGSMKSNSNRSSSQSLYMLSPGASARPFAAGGAPMQFQNSNDSNNSSASEAHPLSASQGGFQESPQSAASNRSMPFSMDTDATPKKNTAGVLPAEPTTARKVPSAQTNHSNGHSRNTSGAESVTYVRERDPEGGRPRWVLERRRTSEQGQLELVGRELVQGGWI